MVKRAVCSFGLLFLLLSSSPMADGQREFIIDVPGATFTRVLGLNAQGDVCGGTQVKGVRLAFTGSRHADFTDLTTFAYPDALFTQCRGINAKGEMVGAYQSADLKFHAFVWDEQGFISIDVPGAIDTRGSGIDPQGNIVGRYTSPDRIVHGFFRFRNGAVLTIDAPGATATEASGITPRGEITGVYRTTEASGSSRFHGFILSTDGFETIDVPGSVNTGTTFGGVWMNRSELAGYYQPEGALPGQFEGWVRVKDGTFHTYLFPGSTDTCFFNINNRGDLVGRYVAGGVEHGLYIERHGRRPPGQ
jgi:probable HAF family extracellular repeat protein